MTQPDRRCDTCQWWQENARCYRYPPTALVADQAGNAFERAVHPRTRPDDWCGEWEQREAEAEADGAA